jgi:hypothetical protein
VTKQRRPPLPKNYKKIFNGATILSACAKGVIGDIEEGKIEISTPTPKLGTTLPPVPFFYDRLAVTPEEHQWFTDRNNVVKVLQLAANSYAEAEEWSLFPDHTLSDAALEIQK